jgi:hypothetical protein
MPGVSSNLRDIVHERHAAELARRRANPSARVSGAIGSTTPCTEAEALARYQKAAAWIAAHGSERLRKALAFHAETVEPRRPESQGGDGTLRPCVVARRRAGIVRDAAVEIATLGGMQ